MLSHASATASAPGRKRRSVSVAVLAGVTRGSSTKAASPARSATLAASRGGTKSAPPITLRASRSATMESGRAMTVHIGHHCRCEAGGSGRSGRGEGTRTRRRHAGKRTGRGERVSRLRHLVRSAVVVGSAPPPIFHLESGPRPETTLQHGRASACRCRAMHRAVWLRGKTLGRRLGLWG